MLPKVSILLFASMLSACAQQTQTPTPAPARTSTLMAPAVAPELLKPAAQVTPEEVQRMQKKLSDWPALAHYREENQRLGPPSQGKPRVVFYGDSITAGWKRLSTKFFTDHDYVDRGIAGQTTEQMVPRFYQDVISLQPEVVVILGGINDIAGNTGPETPSVVEDNLRAMALMAKAAHIRVVLCSLLPSSRIVPRPLSDPTQEVMQINAWIKEYAASEKLTFVNYYPAMVDSIGGIKAELSSDNAVHPNEAGYAVMEPLVQVAISNSLKRPKP